MASSGIAALPALSLAFTSTATAVLYAVVRVSLTASGVTAVTVVASWAVTVRPAVSAAR